MKHSTGRSRRAGLASRAAALCCTALASTALASDDTTRFGPHDVETLFYIAKSNNRDRVDYGMRLDAACHPAGEDPVFPYWRNLERTPVTRHSLGFFARAAYGVSYQKTARTTPTGSDHGLRLKQVDRVIWVTTSRGESGRCTAIVRTRIAGVENAELDSFYAKLGGPFSVDYVDIKGKNLVTGAVLTERLQH
jgi:hypothetical protein